MTTLTPGDYHDQALDQLGGWVMSSTLPSESWQPVHDLVNHTLRAHCPVQINDGPAWCMTCDGISWPCKPYLLALDVLGQMPPTCTHMLGSLRCTNRLPHEGHGRGCTHSHLPGGGHEGAGEDE